jgi:hydroxymethylpyrimidine pyrophosphatase-like HAD family hydrolase
MRYQALACDYDGTLAREGQIDAPTIAALQRFWAGGRRLILVTGRELPDLQSVCSRLDLFDRVVVENGALLYRPATREERAVGPPPSPLFLEQLRQRGVSPLSAGRVIVATSALHENTVREVVRDSGLDLEVILNKDSLMVLPAGINKASGLRIVLREMKLPPEVVVGIGDAENDQVFLAACGYSVAVANALPAVKQAVHLVTTGSDGAGVVELIDRPGAW